MRSAILSAILAATMSFAAAAASDRWVITRDHWSAADEEAYGRFVQALGETPCYTFEECIKSAANPYRDTDSPRWRFPADCADLPYKLRAYFAWKNGLPFSFINHVRTPSRGDMRFSKAGNRIASRYDVVERGTPISARQVLTDIRNTVSTATLRVSLVDDRPPASDFYSPGLTPDGIRPGTVIYDLNGHTAVVYKIGSDGRIHYMDAHPDNTLTRSVYGAQFSRSDPSLGAGFKNWRPIRLVGARNAGGRLVGGRIVHATNDEIATYSVEQFVGTDPAASGKWDEGTFAYEGVELGYYEYVRAAVSGGQMELNPIYELKATMKGLCNDLRDRVRAVQLAVDEGVSRKAHPNRIPSNIYATDDMEWEAYSTPSRDARLKAAFKALRDDMAEMVALWKARDMRIAYGGSDLKGDLQKAYGEENAACRVVYVNSDNRPVVLDFDTAMRRVFAYSFDPYHCVERRWGASGAELASCKDGSLKERWYAAEAGLRNQIERTYEIPNPTTLAGLENWAPGSGARSAPDVDVKAVIDAMGARTPFEGMKPVGY